MTVTVRPPCDEGAILAGYSAVPTSGNSRWTLAATILGSSMAFIDGTVVNVALPALQTALHSTVSEIQWVVEAYALLLASLLLVGGSLRTKKDIYLWGPTVWSGIRLLRICSLHPFAGPRARRTRSGRGLACAR